MEGLILSTQFKIPGVATPEGLPVSSLLAGVSSNDPNSGKTRNYLGSGLPVSQQSGSIDLGPWDFISYGYSITRDPKNWYLGLEPGMLYFLLRSFSVNDNSLFVGGLHHINGMLENAWQEFIRASNDDPANPYRNQDAVDFLALLRKYGEDTLIWMDRVKNPAYGATERRVYEQYKKKSDIERFYQLATEPLLCWVTRFGILKKINYGGVVLGMQRETGMAYELSSAAQRDRSEILAGEDPLIWMDRVKNPAYGATERRVYEQYKKKSDIERFYQLATEPLLCWVTRFGILKKINYGGVVLGMQRETGMAYELSSAAQRDRSEILAGGIARRLMTKNIFASSASQLPYGALCCLILTRTRCLDGNVEGVPYGAYQYKPWSSAVEAYPPRQDVTYLDEKGVTQRAHVINLGIVYAGPEKDIPQSTINEACNLGPFIDNNRAKASFALLEEMFIAHKVH
jgi:hypothetical protein